MRSQSAMEYLMTYGWAILIIAVVLGAIYSLGLFNGTSLAPRNQPGSCQVFRPNGVGTTAYISLAGSCTSELPQYVAQFGGTGNINSGNPPILQITNTITMSAWVNPGPAQTNTNPSIFDKGGNYCANCGYGISLNSGGAGNTAPYKFYCFISSSVRFVLSPNALTGGWSMVTCTYDGGHINEYINGILVSSTVATGAMAQLNYNLYLGSDSGAGEKITGSIANIQVYNSSLDANSVLALYQEGIGGVRINLQSLAAWYPLNGNANDYSGNLDNGQPTAVTYTNQWLGGYNVP